MSKDQFKTRLQIAKEKLSRKNLKQNNQNSSSIGAAFKLSTELVSAVAVGAIIGFILDKSFGTKPWLIIIFFCYWCGCRYNQRNQVSKKNAKIDFFYGSKPNDTIRSL